VLPESWESVSDRKVFELHPQYINCSGQSLYEADHSETEKLNDSVVITSRKKVKKAESKMIYFDFENV